MALTKPKQLNLATLVKKYKYEEITTRQLAEIAQFTESQEALLPMFWNVAFNQSMLYLSDDLILNYLTNETRKDAIAHYYSRILKKYCNADEDYIQIDKNHDLVIKYNTSFYLLNLTNKKADSRGGALRKYYAITGECYKKLLMRASGKKGDEARDYYIKLEKLVIIMKDYISACMQNKFETQLKITQDKDKQLVEYKEISDKKDKVINGMKSLVKNTQISTKDEYIYIAVSPNEFKENKNIIGKTENLKNRLTEYNCKKSGDSTYYFAYYRSCHDAHQIENIIRKALIKFKVNGTKDVFQVRYDYLEAIVDAVLDGQDAWTILCNNLLFDASNDEYYSKPIPLPEKKEIIDNSSITSESTATEQPTSITPLDLLSEDELVKKIKELIGKYVILRHELDKFNYDEDKDAEIVEEKEIRVKNKDGKIVKKKVDETIMLIINWSECS